MGTPTWDTQSRRALLSELADSPFAFPIQVNPRPDASVLAARKRNHPLAADKKEASDGQNGQRMVQVTTSAISKAGPSDSSVYILLFLGTDFIRVNVIRVGEIRLERNRETALFHLFTRDEIFHVGGCTTVKEPFFEKSIPSYTDQCAN